MQQTNTYQSHKVNNKEINTLDDTIVIEAPLQININGEPYTVVMRTPNNDKALVQGLLYAEDIYKESNLKTEVISYESNHFSTINCIIPSEKLGNGYLNKRTLLSVASCGICGRQELDDLNLQGDALKSETTLALRDLPKLFKKMSDLQTTFKASGGSHAVSIFDKNQALLTLNEDIGRHNAVDKCVGDLVAKNQLKQAFCMLVSGRASYEIISKAFIAKIPIVVAVSACSSLAIDYAKELNICLIGFSRGEKSTIYANPHHLKMDD